MNVKQFLEIQQLDAADRKEALEVICDALKQRGAPGDCIEFVLGRMAAAFDQRGHSSSVVDAGPGFQAAPALRALQDHHSNAIAFWMKTNFETLVELWLALQGRED